MIRPHVCTSAFTPLLVFPVCYNETYKCKSLREHQQTAVDGHTVCGSSDHSFIIVKNALTIYYLYDLYAIVGAPLPD